MHLLARLRWFLLCLLVWLAQVTLTSPAQGREPSEVALQGPVDLAAANNSAPGDAPRLLLQRTALPKPPNDYQSVEGGWIRIHYAPGTKALSQSLLEASMSMRRELTEQLGLPVLRGVDVRLARTAKEMKSLAPEGSHFPAYAAGVAYPEQNLILLTLVPPTSSEPQDVVETFRHELAHLALHDAVNGHAVPRWFDEGYAIYASGERSTARLQTLWTASLSHQLLSLERLELSFPEDAATALVAYAQAADVLRFLLRDQDRYRFQALIEQLGKGNTFEHALSTSYELDRAMLEYEWREDIARRYTFWPVLFSTGLLWMGIIGLFFLGAHRKRKQNRRILERWSREDAAVEIEQAESPSLTSEQEAPRVHIVMVSPSLRPTPLPKTKVSYDSEVPKIEHDGATYTLH